MVECVMTLATSGESRVFPHGTLIADALFDIGVAFDTPCGGKGTCSKCRIRISDFLVEQNSGQSPALDSPVWVLACKTRMKSDLTVYVPPKIPVDVLTIPHLLNDHTYSIAVDIGMTSVRMSLVDTATKRSFEIASFLNPQRK